MHASSWCLSFMVMSVIKVSELFGFSARSYKMTINHYAHVCQYSVVSIRGVAYMLFDCTIHLIGITFCNIGPYWVKRIPDERPPDKRPLRQKTTRTKDHCRRNFVAYVEEVYNELCAFKINSKSSSNISILVSTNRHVCC